MKKLVILSVICAALLSLASCRPSKPNGSKEAETIQLTDESQVDLLLNKLQGEIYALSMMTHDVCDNADGIINTEERINKIIKAVEENPQLLTPEQQERYQTLREEYRKQSGY